MKTLVGQIKLEIKLFFREKVALFWTLAFPIFFIVIFGLIYQDHVWNDIPAINFLVPGIIVMAMMSTCIIGVIEGFVEEREKGIYRRLSLTPLKRQTLLGGKIISLYIVVLLQTAVLIGIGVLFFSASIGGNYLIFWLVLTFGAISFMAIGFSLTSLAKTVQSAHPISMIPFFILMFLGGIFFPIEQMPSFLRPVCNALPSTHLGEALRMVLLEEAGIGTIWKNILILLGWFAGFFVLSVKFLKWEWN